MRHKSGINDKKIVSTRAHRVTKIFNQQCDFFERGYSNHTPFFKEGLLITGVQVWQEVSVHILANLEEMQPLKPAGK